ncbi:4989_t:CDS:2, partial [Gigaspora rosea]
SQLIGLISLCLLYINGRGIIVNQSIYLFLNSAAKGSSLGKFYIAEEGNASAKIIVGYCYYTDNDISKNFS